MATSNTNPWNAGPVQTQTRSLLPHGMPWRADSLQHLLMDLSFALIRRLQASQAVPTLFVGEVRFPFKSKPCHATSSQYSSLGPSRLLPPLQPVLSLIQSATMTAACRATSIMGKRSCDVEPRAPKVMAHRPWMRRAMYFDVAGLTECQSVGRSA